MPVHSIVRDVKESIENLASRSLKFTIGKLPGIPSRHRAKSKSSVYVLHDEDSELDQSRWANLPLELLYDVMKRLEQSESTWPARKDVVACAAVCRSWRQMCKDVVRSPEFSGRLTFPVSLKQPGPRDGTIQCYVKRDKSKQTYHLYLSLSPSVLVENGKFLLAAKRYRRATGTEYIISINAENISRSSSSYVGKLRSNFMGAKFVIYDTQPPYYASSVSQAELTGSRRIFPSKKVSPRVPTSSYRIAQVTYELNVLGPRGPRRIECIMHSIPASALEPGGVVPGKPKELMCNSFEESFRSTVSRSKSSVIDRSIDFGSPRFSELNGGNFHEDRQEEIKEKPMVLRNKTPRWHEQLQCWCLNFRGRVTIASVKNFQLIAAPQPMATADPAVALPSDNAQPIHPSQPPQTASSDHDKIILQFGKVAKDTFTLDYRYPLSAFHAFAICLTSFDSKMACE